jgi:hypothetical protein
MKKVLLPILALAALTMTSCKKDYTCTCTGYIDGVAVPGSASSTTINAKKSDAESKCNSGDQAPISGISVNCEIQ